MLVSLCPLALDSKSILSLALTAYFFRIPVSPENHFVAEEDFELLIPPAFNSQILGLQAWLRSGFILFPDLKPKLAEGRGAVS